MSAASAARRMLRCARALGGGGGGGGVRGGGGTGGGGGPNHGGDGGGGGIGGGAVALLPVGSSMFLIVSRQPNLSSAKVGQSSTRTPAYSSASSSTSPHCFSAPPMLRSLLHQQERNLRGSRLL